jgi:hypothetical protein
MNTRLIYVVKRFGISEEEWMLWISRSSIAVVSGTIESPGTAIEVVKRQKEWKTLISDASEARGITAATLIGEVQSSDLEFMKSWIRAVPIDCHAEKCPSEWYITSVITLLETGGFCDPERVRNMRGMLELHRGMLALPSR